jgi:ribosomal protein S13
MAFTQEEKQALLALKGVGETIIKRLEQINIDSYEKLSQSSVEEITEIVSDILNTTCWKNSPQAKSAIDNAITFAKEHS